MKKIALLLPALAFLAWAGFTIFFSLIDGRIRAAPSNVVLNGRDPDTVLLESIEAKVKIIDTHFHNVARWTGSGGSSVTMTAVIITAGNDGWGDWVTVLTTDSTPLCGGKLTFDIHKILVPDVDTAALHRLQVGWGATGGILASEQYTEIMLIPTGIGANVSPSPRDIRMPRIDVGTTVSARAWVNGANGDTVETFFGIHEYDE